MEFFTARCLRRGMISIDGSYQGENKDGNTLRIFQCPAGLHDITLEYRSGQTSHKQTRRVMITGTNAIVPMAIAFIAKL